MNEKEILNQIKFQLSQFPDFFKDITKNPMKYVRQDTRFDWVKITLFTFMVSAITSLIYTIGTLNFSGLVGAIIFTPMQTLIIIGFVSFILWLVFDKLGFVHIDYLRVFRLLALTQIIVSIYAVLPITLLFLLRSYTIFHFVAVVLIVAKAYLIYVGFDQQFNVAKKRAVLIVVIMAFVFAAPAVGDFFETYDTYQQQSELRRTFEIQNEQSADIIKQELEFNKDK